MVSVETATTLGPAMLNPVRLPLLTDDCERLFTS